ncbi:hypothetical protein CFC21_017782 [Triticum aestivum]|uniref:Uncharacterized protein n=2 Tax=Triticum aestivum TaxID=4565 RepID=A0A341VDW3_WHEAT|nr:acyl transferase 15-like [Triticum aestivum]XP_044384493.1 acyl transferase 15-like [Triticum aestivum]XP_044385212.1 acyl transferase 15-like [Triticum aestivum]KAF6989826.1 hypothetical protein CFC21_007114 [Triticum aestivum]KAF7002275.1 hypothetical protein CFC21_017782 [Triticum aestivum]
MSVVVISKSPPVLIAPSEAIVIGEDINLSSYDKMFGGRAVTVFFIFESPIQDPMETIKRGLSQALVHYYPIAGRLAVGATSGEFVIKCTGEGVSFVAASANCAVKDVPDFCDSSLQEELAVFHAAEGFSNTEPLVLMQVTVFTCGGFVLGVMWNHAIGDGTGMAQFMQAIGELARRLPSPSVIPVRSKNSLVLDLPPFSTNFVQFLGTLQPSPMVFLDITVSSSLVNHIKSNYMMNYKRPCSVFEAVAAVLWQCRTRAIMSDPSALVVLTFPANARKHAVAREGYYGNCVTAQLVTASTGAVVNGDLMELVKMIQHAKDRVSGQSEIDELRQLDGYNLFFMSCWRNLGMEAIDFGFGPPARLMEYTKVRTTLPSCATCVPCNDEYNVQSICVIQEHADAFIRELAKSHLTYNLLSASSKL